LVQPLICSIRSHNPLPPALTPPRPML
jgi:hypothetical protein